MEKEQILGDMKPTEAWTEDSWDPYKYTAEKRKEILSTMSKKAREEQKKLEEARKKEEEERKQQELKEELERKQKEEKEKQSKKENEKKKKDKKKNDTLIPTYTKAELKRAEAIRREKQRERDIKRNEEAKEKEREMEEAMLAESAAESASSASTAEEEYKVDQSAHWCPLFVGFLVVVLLFVLVVRLFPTYRLRSMSWWTE
ncbi:uncharacterized protein [Blastocystis hominis]|uniref:Uncharacterized protein n=1 Tax=Blastocystis hominis TaxID=12968 RepID=D8M1U3_BLAHO|nr:uncharacterized protein [Blastocystis hominis]CBK22032.2 unnamed protein product [Blastocystis hominis]|eukprot:XP_012896080.1 uncharacterized protein [Blastocystis hominis]